MPFKHNAAHRHRIGKMKFKVTNWPEYEAGLRQRGSLTLWIMPEALASWLAPKRMTRGGQPRYSDLAIETTLMLGMVFGLRLRQTEGFLTSVLQLMGLDLAVPDHTTLSRRARTWRSSDERQGRSISGEGPVHVLIDSTGLEVYGAGQWLKEKHGARSRRGWRKLHLALDADSGEIIAHILTDQDTGDASQVEPLLGPVPRTVHDLGLFHHLLIGVNVLQADAVSSPEEAQAPRHVLIRRDRQDRDIRTGPGDAAPDPDHGTGP
jgi:hypothetical protein